MTEPINEHTDIVEDDDYVDPEEFESADVDYEED